MIIGLGSNRCHGVHGRPEAVLRAAIVALEACGLKVKRRSRIRATAPLGPSIRRFANAAILGRWNGDSHSLLTMLKAVERDFGRRPGRRWGARVLDCDILAFGGEIVATPGLQIPHPGLHERSFVLQPMRDIAPGWRHPLLALTVRQMAARLDRRHPASAA